MALFTDTVTIYNEEQGNWMRTVVKGVQWSEKVEKSVSDKKVSAAKYISLTFPEGTYENIPFNLYDENTCIVYGEVYDEVTNERGYRTSDLCKKYSRSGFVQSVNDNSNRSYLKNIKVVIA